jgi:hypothetical protein
MTCLSKRRACDDKRTECREDHENWLLATEDLTPRCSQLNTGGAAGGAAASAWAQATGGAGITG